MVAGTQSCTCEECGAECPGKFEGCADVWLTGPVKRAPIDAGIQLPTRGVTSSPTAPVPSAKAETLEALNLEALHLEALHLKASNLEASNLEASNLEALNDDERFEHLETTVAKLGRDVRSLHKRLRQPPELASSFDERLDQVDRRIDSIAVDLGDALRLMQQSLPDERLDQVSRWVDDVRVEMREALDVLRGSVRDLVVDQSTAPGASLKSGVITTEAMWPPQRPPHASPPLASPPLDRLHREVAHKEVAHKEVAQGRSHDPR